MDIFPTVNQRGSSTLNATLRRTGSLGFVARVLFFSLDIRALELCICEWVRVLYTNILYNQTNPPPPPSHNRRAFVPTALSENAALRPAHCSVEIRSSALRRRNGE